MHRQPTTPPCPGCGAFARVFRNGQSQCPYCGTTLPPLPFTHAGGYFRHESPIKIGMSAKITGKAYVAVGRIQFEQMDDGTVYTWDETLLLSQDGEARYLEFDEGKWTISEGFNPSDAPAPHELMAASPGRTYRLQNLTVSVTDAGSCTVSAVEGEIPWEVERGSRNQFVDLEGGGGFFGAEIGSDGEVEWFRGRRMEEATILEMFGLKKEAEVAVGKQNARADRSKFGCLTSVLALVALFGGCAGSMNAGKVVASGSSVVSQIPADGKVFGPYNLTKANKVHRLKVSTSISQTSVWVQAVVEDKAGELFDTQADMWDETGYDDEGSWHEYSLNSSKDFKVAQPGQYFVRLYAEPEPAAANATVNFALEEGVMYPTYLIAFGVAGLILGIIFVCAGAPDKTKQVWASMSDD